MKLKLYCVGADASLSGSMYKSWLEILGSIGMKLASGIILIAKTKMFERIFVISDPIEINKQASRQLKWDNYFYCRLPVRLHTISLC